MNTQPNELPTTEYKLVARIARAYALPVAHILPPQKGYRNSAYPLQLANGNTVNLILYKTEAGIITRIKNANRIGDYLAGQGFAARRTASARLVKLQAGERVKYAALYHYLPGTTIPWDAYTRDRIKALGQTMSDMHAALKKVPRGDLPLATTEATQLNTRMLRYFTDSNVRRALKQKLGLTILHDDYRPILRACQKLPSQPLHMDFVRSNILFDGNNITGILDFEKTAFGPTLIDIARTLAFLLVDCKYKPEDKVRKYFLQSGYAKYGAATYKNYTIAERDLVEYLVDFFLLHDLYKFLRHNPYEFLLQNQHFIRTRELLRKRSIIGYNELKH